MGKTIITVTILITACVANANQTLVEIDRVGNTASIQLHYINKSIDISDRAPSRMSPETWFSNLLPIHTDNMSPGIVKPRKIDINTLMRPVFIIGSDDMSIRWVRENKQALLNNHAVGMLVEVNSLKKLKQIAELTKGLPLAPANGKKVSELLDLKHYPVLITRHSIEQ